MASLRVLMVVMVTMALFASVAEAVDKSHVNSYQEGTLEPAVINDKDQLKSTLANAAAKHQATKVTSSPLTRLAAKQAAATDGATRVTTDPPKNTGTDKTDYSKKIIKTEVDATNTTPAPTTATATTSSGSKVKEPTSTKSDVPKKTVKTDPTTDGAKVKNSKNSKAKTDTSVPKPKSALKNTRKTLKIRDDLPDYAKAAKLKLNQYIESGQTWPGQPDVMGCTPLECREWCEDCGGSITCQSKCFNNLYCRDECEVLS